MIRFIIWLLLIMFVWVDYSYYNFDINKVLSAYKEELVEEKIKIYGERNKPILEKIFDYSIKYGIDYDIFCSIIYQESRFDSMAVSEKGAKGLGQIMDETAEYITFLMNKTDYNIFSVDDNLDITGFYLKQLKSFSKDWNEVLARYYAGSKWFLYTYSSYVTEILGRTKEEI